MDAAEVEDVLFLFLSNEYFAEWKSYFTNNSATFNESSDISSDFTLAQYDIYQRFNDLVDVQLRECCKSLGFSSQIFYESCKLLSSTKNIAVDVFSTLVVASTEIHTFADIMSNDDKRNYFIHVVESWRVTLQGSRK